MCRIKGFQDESKIKSFWHGDAYMYFLIITLLVMIASVFAAHKTVNRFGLKLGYEPLVLCALAAMAVEFILPSVARHTAGYSLFLFFGIILLSAAAITGVNEKLVVKRLAADEKRIEKAAALPVTESIADAADALAPDRDLPTDEESEYRGKTGQTSPGALESLVNLNCLDALLDYAYEKKKKTAYQEALFAFQLALDKYKNDGYAPFITIEIGNIYKNVGFYDEAIIMLGRALKLQAVSSNCQLRMEFIEMISYLRIVKTILLKYNYCRIPFDEIPKSIMLEIEQEFERCRTQSFAS